MVNLWLKPVSVTGTGDLPSQIKGSSLTILAEPVSLASATSGKVHSQNMHECDNMFSYVIWLISYSCICEPTSKITRMIFAGFAFVLLIVHVNIV